MAAPPRGPCGGISNTVSNTYDVDQGKALANASLQSQPAQLLCGLEAIWDRLNQSRIPCAVMGGFALNLRGSDRSTHDIDLAVGCNMFELRQAFIGQPRFKVPRGPTSDVLRVFIEVGSKYGEAVKDCFVQVDAILDGKLGAPERLQGRTEVVNYPPSGTSPKQFTVLGIIPHLQSKLSAFQSRGQISRDYDDIIFMCNKFPDKISGDRDQLNLEHRQTFIRCYEKQSNVEANIEMMKILFFGKPEENQSLGQGT